MCNFSSRKLAIALFVILVQTALSMAGDRSPAGGDIGKITEAPACPVFVDLHYNKHEKAVRQKLTSLGYTLVNQRENAKFLVQNGGSWEHERESAQAEASLMDIQTGANTPYVRIIGYDTIQFLWTKGTVVNRLTSMLLAKLPTCEMAKAQTVMLNCGDHAQGPCTPF